MFGSALIGVIAALVVVVATALPVAIPSFGSPFAMLLPAILILVLQRLALDRKRWMRDYDGLADLMIHIHSPSSPDSSLRWLMRGGISFFLLICGIPVGAEGPAIELTHASAIQLRSSSGRWFEQRRRTDAASALAGGVAAAFGAPFAAVILPMEMGIGGRNILTIVSAFSAYVTLRYFAEQGQVRIFDLSSVLYDFRFGGFREWVGLLVVALCSGLLGVLLIRFIDRTRKSLSALFPLESRLGNLKRTLFSLFLLALIAVVYRAGHGSPTWQLEQVFWLHKTLPEAWLTFGVQLLAFTLVMAAFGTMGAFWPSFAVGGLFGFGGMSLILSAEVLSANGDLAVLAGLVGGVSIWGALFGTPVAAAVLAFELTHNFYVLIPCFLAGLLAHEVRRRLKTDPLVDTSLRARGTTLAEGRSVEILESLRVKDVLVTDHETVHEQEALVGLHRKLLESRYQYLPVVNSRDQYTGLLTADMIQDAWQTQGAVLDAQPLSQLVEAKDILYRVQDRTPVVKITDRLSVTSGLFREVPCVAVIDDGKKVQGLLFAHSVRVAYEREVARRSLASVQLPEQ